MALPDLLSSSQYAFNILAIMTFGSAVIIFILGFLTFFQNRNSIVHIAFLFTTLSFSLWLFGMTGFYMSTKPLMMRAWFAIAFLGISTTSVSFFFLISSFLQKQKELKRAIILGYGITLFFFIVSCCGDAFITGFKRFSWGWYPQLGLISYPFMFVWIGYWLWTVWLCIRAIPDKRTFIERPRFNYVVVGFFIMSTAAPDFIPAYGFDWYPYGYFPVLCFVIITVYAMQKYRLLLLTPSMAADTIVNTMADALIVFDGDGRVTLVNPVTAYIWGCTSESLINRSVEDMFVEREIFHETSLVKIAVAKVYSGEVTCVSTNGDRIPLSMGISVVKNSWGGVSGFVGVAHDIRRERSFIQELKQKTTAIEEELMKRRAAEAALKSAYEQLKKTQDQLVQSEKMASLGVLAAGVAHEINNPLGFITSNFETLKLYLKAYNKIFEAIDVLIDEVNVGATDLVLKSIDELRALRQKEDVKFAVEDMDPLIIQTLGGLDRVKKIVLDLKTFAHSGMAALTEVDLNKLLDNAINICWNELKYKAKLIKHYGQVPLIKCHEQKVEQVFINILINAAQAIAGQGEIQVATYAEKDKVFVQIADTGKGIAPEHLGKIFDPFFTTKPVGQGTGLGLSVSYDIVKQHGGTILVESKMGQGTTFTIVLPVPGGAL